MERSSLIWSSGNWKDILGQSMCHWVQCWLLLSQLSRHHVQVCWWLRETSQEDLQQSLKEQALNNFYWRNWLNGVCKIWQWKRSNQKSEDRIFDANGWSIQHQESSNGFGSNKSSMVTWYSNNQKVSQMNLHSFARWEL